MELRKPRPTGTTSEAANDLQHEAAMRVQARIDAEEARERARARAKMLRNLAVSALLLAVLGGCFWAWKSGLLDSPLDRPADPVPPPKTEAPVPTAPAARGTAAAPAASGASETARPQPAATEKRAEPKLFLQTLSKFAGVKVGYWTQVDPEDRSSPERPLDYVALFPKGHGDFAVAEIRMAGRALVSGNFITEDDRLEPLSRETFRKLMAGEDFLVARGARGYICAGGASKRRPAPRLPAPGASFCPSRAEFGEIADLLATVKAVPPAKRYRVTFQIEKLKKELEIAAVGFGESVPREKFEQAVRPLIDDDEMRAELLSAGKVRVMAVE